MPSKPPPPTLPTRTRKYRVQAFQPIDLDDNGSHGWPGLNAPGWLSVLDTRSAEALIPSQAAKLELFVPIVVPVVTRLGRVRGSRFYDAFSSDGLFLYRVIVTELKEGSGS